MLFLIASCHVLCQALDDGKEERAVDAIVLKLDFKQFLLKIQYNNI